MLYFFQNSYIDAITKRRKAREALASTRTTIDGVVGAKVDAENEQQRAETQIKHVQATEEKERADAERAFTVDIGEGAVRAMTINDQQ